MYKEQRLEEVPDLNRKCSAETYAWPTRLGFVSPVVLVE